MLHATAAGLVAVCLKPFGAGAMRIDITGYVIGHGSSATLQRGTWTYRYLDILEESGQHRLLRSVTCSDRLNERLALALADESLVQLVFEAGADGWRLVEVTMAGHAPRPEAPPSWPRMSLRRGLMRLFQREGAPDGAPAR